MRWIFACILWFVLSQPLAALDLFVAPHGDDAAPGTREAPLASLTGARDAIRRLKQTEPLTSAIRVLVADGAYVLDAPFVLEPIDSGTPTAPISYEALPGATPVFSGGVPLGPWAATDEGLWKAPTPRVDDQSLRPEQLHVGSRRAIRAREPNASYFELQGAAEEPLAPDDPSGREARQTLPLAPEAYAVLESLSPAELSGVRLIAYHKWDVTRRQIDRLDPAAHALVTSGERMKPWNPLAAGALVQFENFRAALDAPGEWFWDDQRNAILYRPLPGEDLRESTAIVPRLERLVQIAGDADGGAWVEHVALRGLAFRHGAWREPPAGFEPAQAAAPIEAAVQIDGARHVTLERCEVGHVATYGVWFRRGCYDCTLRQSLLHDLGAGGVRIGETSISPDPAARTARIVVDNNIVRHGGRIFPCAVGVWIGQSGDNVVSRNDVADFYYTGISVGWRWGYDESLAKRNRIAYNRVGHLGWGVLSDMGGIYTLGPSEGTEVVGNVFHDVYSSTYGGWGLYTDEGSTGVLFADNLVYRTKSGGFHQHYGRENVVRNNIFAFSREQQLQATRVEDHQSFAFERNIVLFARGAMLAGPWDRIRYVSGGNCYWRVDGAPPDFLGQSLPQWQAAGHEIDSIVADPGFADPDQGDFSLQSDSPVVALGFQPFAAEAAGVYGPAAWRGRAAEPIVPPAQPPTRLPADW